MELKEFIIWNILLQCEIMIILDGIESRKWGEEEYRELERDNP